MDMGGKLGGEKGGEEREGEEEVGRECGVKGGREEEAEGQGKRLRRGRRCREALCPYLSWSAPVSGIWSWALSLNLVLESGFLPHVGAPNTAGLLWTSPSYK